MPSVFSILLCANVWYYTLYSINYSPASFLPSAMHAASASSSGASLQMTLSPAKTAPSPSRSLPVAHPFAVAPAVRAEQTDHLAGKLCFALGKHRLKLRVLPAARSHGRAAERHSLIVIHQVCGELCAVIYIWLLRPLRERLLQPFPPSSGCCLYHSNKQLLFYAFL